MIQPGDMISYQAPGREVELGFVTSIRRRAREANICYCRFWESTDPPLLRTRAGSEACDANRLRAVDYGLGKEIRFLCQAMGWIPK